jgi:hypothetical protein
VKTYTYHNDTLYASGCNPQVLSRRGAVWAMLGGEAKRFCDAFYFEKMRPVVGKGRKFTITEDEIKTWLAFRRAGKI